MAPTGQLDVDRASVRDRLHARGLRWTLQRSILLDVLEQTDGHVTGAELVERCRAVDPTTTPSTVYRTLDVLEELGVVRHHHGADGREEFHVRPATAHGHLHCGVCGQSWELGPAELAPLVTSLRAARGFDVDLSHVTVAGTCRDCQARLGQARLKAAAED
ncbi:MAG TPA: Fur family transcriptional regulator [Candidatus Limnocylindrales bacterium]